MDTNPTNEQSGKDSNIIGKRSSGPSRTIWFYQKQTPFIQTYFLHLKSAIQGQLRLTWFAVDKSVRNQTRLSLNELQWVTVVSPWPAVGCLVTGVWWIAVFEIDCRHTFYCKCSRTHVTRVTTLIIIIWAYPWNNYEQVSSGFTTMRYQLWLLGRARCDEQSWNHLRHF